MRHALITVVVSLLLLLTGCGSSKQWAKPGATADDFHRDSYACANESRQSWFEFRRVPFGPSSDEKGINKELYRACLQARGYQRVEGGEWKGLRD